MISTSRFSILGQLDHGGREERIAQQLALTDDIYYQGVALQDIAEHAEALAGGACLPIGNVAFLRAAMALAGIVEPANLSYPDVLRPYLHRDVSVTKAGHVLGHWFVKPLTTKVFTGCVFDTLGDPDHLDEHDRVQYDAFLALSPDTPVWVCEPVSWRSEVRYYVLEGEVLGEGRYDDGPDEARAPEEAVVREMVQRLSAAKGAPVAFALDAGVLDSGTTALVEVNDAWALGFYSGTLAPRQYLQMLWKRWQQLLAQRDTLEDLS